MNWGMVTENGETFVKSSRQPIWSPVKGSTSYHTSKLIRYLFLPQFAVFLWNKRSWAWKQERLVPKLFSDKNISHFIRCTKNKIYQRVWMGRSWNYLWRQREVFSGKYAKTVSLNKAFGLQCTSLHPAEVQK